MERISSEKEQNDKWPRQEGGETRGTCENKEQRKQWILASHEKKKHCIDQYERNLN